MKIGEIMSKNQKKEILENKAIIERISSTHWIKRWAGSYTFISCSYWASQYDKVLHKILGIGFKSSLFIHRKGIVTFLIKKDELDNFGRTLAKKAELDKEYAKAILKKLKDNTTAIMMIMQELEGKIPSPKQYIEFLNVFERHLAYHNFMKKAVDYMPAPVLNSLIENFKDARLYSEPVYSRTESFFRELAKAIAKKEHYDSLHLTCLTQDELERYLKSNTLPDKAILEARYNASVIYYAVGKQIIFVGADVDKVEQAILTGSVDEISTEQSNCLNGISAYPGKVKGICRVVKDPHDVNIFNQGDILITGMTRPEFLSYFRKASAIVTDVGGMLCHAALTARELKKPCIVGTVNATSFFKDGELVEVDANKGIVKKATK